MTYNILQVYRVLCSPAFCISMNKTYHDTKQSQQNISYNEIYQKRNISKTLHIKRKTYQNFFF